MHSIKTLILALWLIAINGESLAEEVSSIANDNVRFSLSVEKHQNDNKSRFEQKVNLALKITQNDKALTNTRPKVWLSLRRSEQVATETSCKAKIKNFLSGQLATRADVDLNSYFLVTLNQDKTITFIDPQVAWSSGKLQGIVQLPEQGLDWVLTKDNKWLYVSMPAASAVAVIDTANHNLLETISTGKNTKPTRLALSPDEKSLWVGLDDSSQVAVINRNEKSKLKLIDVGEGLHQIALMPDNALALVTNTKANTVSVLDTVKQIKLGDISVGNTPLKPVWLPKAERFYVPAVNDSMLSIIDPVKREVEARIDVGRGIVEAASDPEGRYLWLVNQVESKTYVIDTATNKTVAFATLTADPDQIAFTADYAYFRSLGSEKFTLINRQQLTQLSTLSKQDKAGLAELSATQIQAGEKPPVFTPEAIGVAPMIVPLPENNGAMIASAPGKTIYYYNEGMMVPMGTLDNYGRIPRGLLVLNRSLQETSPGVFEAPVNIQKSGNYDVAVLIDQPRIVHCFTAKLTANTESEKAAEQKRPTIHVQLLPLKSPLKANEEVQLNFKLVDSKSGQGVTGIQDARALVFEPPGLWQKRVWLQETEAGIYQALVSFPQAGNFNVLVEAHSKSLKFRDQELTQLKVETQVKP